MLSETSLGLVALVRMLAIWSHLQLVSRLELSAKLASTRTCICGSASVSRLVGNYFVKSLLEKVRSANTFLLARELLEIARSLHIFDLCF